MPGALLLLAALALAVAVVFVLAEHFRETKLGEAYPPSRRASVSTPAGFLRGSEPRAGAQQSD